MARQAEPGVMHNRPNPCPGAAFQFWHIHPVREYTDYNGGSFMQTCDDEESLLDDNPEAIGPVLFGVYLHAISGPKQGEWRSVADFRTYEDAIEFLDDVAGPYTPEG